MKKPPLHLLLLPALASLASLASGQTSPSAFRPTATSGAPSSSAPAPTSGKRSINVYEALVTMIDDVHVPATELGMLTALHAAEGHQVDEEALLADIDNRESIARQLIAQGEYDASVAQAESTAEVEVAEKAIDVAQAELDSLEEVRARSKGAVSETEIRKFKFQLDRAKAQLKLAQTDRNIASLTAKVKAAQLQSISIELDRRQVKAPFKGEVIEIFKKRGEWVQPGEPILHLVRMDKVKVKGFVLLSSGASPDEVEGKPVEITVYSAGEKQHTVKGTIGFASRVIEGVSKTRQFRIWAEVDNPKVIDPVTKKQTWAIQPGTMANMTIDLSGAAAPAATRVNTYKPAAGGQER